MTPASPLEAVFFAALELTGPDRAAYLDAACARDGDLRRRVERMLAAQAGAGSFLEHPAGDPDDTTDQRPAAEGPGTVIGPYKLLEVIGEGGFGVVFLAEQVQPVRRRVALKILKPGMDTRQVVARFEAERQALALMDHPNIARVFDGGATQAGRPFFVMELVRGVRITDYCDEAQLAPRQRLELFLQVCGAVQHAHQKGIIHRDVKPSNVLVSRHDTTPVVKVIDFGVAKALGQDLTDKTLFTGIAQMIGTPLYMSPEQAGMSDLDVDTRSDIYSLGVLLYELLTGTTPFARERFQTAAYDEIRRIIREEEPARPSARISTLGLAADTVSVNRRSDPKQLSRLVRGELDWIVMKALEKDRARRYDTAAGLASDVRRYLADEPVLACPPSAGYRLRKFIRRHRHVLAGTLAVVLLLVTAVTALTVDLVSVKRERREKEAALEAEGTRRKQARTALDAMSSMILENLLGRQPVLLPEHKVFLEQALRYYEEFAADTGQDEESRAGVAGAFYRVGFIRQRLGQWAAATAAWEACRDLCVALVADFPQAPDHRHHLTNTLGNLGNLYRSTGRVPEAEATLRQGMATGRALVAEVPVEPTYRRGLAILLNDLGIVLKNTSQFPEAEAVFDEALLLHRRLAGDFPGDPEYRDSLAQTLLSQGLLFEITSRPEAAVRSFGEAVGLYTRLIADHPAVARYRDQSAIVRNNLGNVLRDARRHPEAEEVFRQALTTRRELVAEFPSIPNYRRGLAITVNNLAILLKNTDRAQEAEDLYGQAVDIHKRLAAEFPTVSDHQSEAGGAILNLARVRLTRKDFDGARRLLEEGVPYHQAALKANPRHPSYRNNYRLNRWRMAETLLGLNDHAAAAAAAREFLDVAYDPPRDAYTAAGLLAGCVRLAALDVRLTEAKRQESATAYGDRALAALRQAVDKGAKELAQMAKDSSLDPLRARADFQKLLAEVNAKGKP
ncbi:MAG TPA: serine/threonine-protein kinase [Gemmataceae bacterium]|nr:serine/threonine-protein kinase [Gemmataceae bacterium]